ncbi:MAG TPA: hypothetical protein PLX89_13195 [Verrucomicrobiota bacterium]|nr:hypothetical protein [Verrucomicrobiales bacterium]HRI13950.1 hypothetical protein [Verrucomicrobiota bacterium]
MRVGWISALVLGLAVMTGRAEGVDAKIFKVLPHLLDEQGRISISPGLFEREAYQKQLRENLQRVSGLRYDVQWKAPGTNAERLRLRIQLRTAKLEPHRPLTIEAGVNDHRRWGGWSSVQLDGTAYREAGEVLAWRAVLLDGESEIAEQKSFLW